MNSNSDQSRASGACLDISALPATPADVRNFVGSDFCSLKYGSEDHEPDENDIYTLSAHDLISAFSELHWASEAAHVCGEAYQVVGSLLSDLGKFETPEAEKILDNLSEARLVHLDVLPWESYEVRASDSAAASQSPNGSDLLASHQRLKDALERLLGSDEGIARATETELCDAANDVTQTPLLREQAASVLQARAALKAAP